MTIGISKLDLSLQAQILMGSYGRFLGPRGKILYVDSTAAGAGNSQPGRRPTAPFATVASAVASATANVGDLIVIAPGHTETIATAGGITCAVAGVTIIGLGTGASRPTFSFSGTAASWVISAASVYIANIRVTPSIDEVVSMFSVTGADCTFDAVDHVDAGAALQTIQFLLTTSGATRITIKNCYHVQTTAAAAAQRWIYIVGAATPRLLDNTFVLALNDGATSCVIGLDTAVRNAELGRNKGKMTGYSANLLSFVLAAAAATGFEYDSRFTADVAAITTINDFPGGYSLECYVVRVVDKNAILDPVISAT